MTTDQPRLGLASLPTPLQHLGRLGAAVGAARLDAKRDDLTGFGVTGNKARPLEFLMGQALAEGCEVVVGAGAPTSNFIAGLALAAGVAGLRCELLVSEGKDGVEALDVEHPNVELARAAGADVLRVAGPRELLDELVAQRADELRRDGCRALAVPRGGSTAVGCLGFVEAAFELHEQTGGRPLTVVVPAGSGASVAGLGVGAAVVGAVWDIVGVSVSRPLEAATSHVDELARACAALIGCGPPARVTLVDARGAETATQRRLAEAALRTEGLLLDPTYGVPTLPVAVERAQRGEHVVVWQTGGVVAALARLRSLRVPA